MFPPHRIIGAAQCAFEISQYGVYPIEFGLLHGGSTAVADDPVMLTAHLGEDVEAGQTSADHGATGKQMLNRAGYSADSVV